MTPPTFSYSGDTLVQNELGLGELLDFRFPEGTKFLVHLVVEELLLPPLSAQDIIHVQARLFDNLVKEF